LNISDYVSKSTYTEPEQASRVRASHPNGWEPGVKYDIDAGVPLEVTTPPVPELEEGADWRSILEFMNFDLPEGYELRLKEAKYDPAAWSRDEEFVVHPETNKKIKAPAVTKPVWRYKFSVVKVGLTAEISIDILNRLKRSTSPTSKNSGNGAFVVNVADWQIGKDTLEEGGDTESAIERLDGFFSQAVERAIELKNHTDELVVWGLGDLVEGACIFSNQSYQVDRDRRQQINITASLLVDLIDRLSGHFNRVRVPMVGGNHGEQRVDMKRVNRGSNDDLLVGEIAARELSRDSRSQHVSFILAGQDPALTIDIKGHIVGGTHGQVYGKSKGATADQKAREWLKSMALARKPIGDADLLLAGHFHHLNITDFGKCLFVQSPATDGGSPGFTDSSGTENEPGMVTFVITEEKKFTQFELLT